MSRSDPACKSCATTKYKPRVEISLVLPSCESANADGIRTMIGRVRSYLRALRRSGIPPIHDARGGWLDSGRASLREDHTAIRSKTGRSNRGVVLKINAP